MLSCILSMNLLALAKNQIQEYRLSEVKSRQLVINAGGQGCKQCLKSMEDYFKLVTGIEKVKVIGPLTSQGEGLLPGWSLIEIYITFNPKLISENDILAKISFMDYKVFKIIHKNQD